MAYKSANTTLVLLTSVILNFIPIMISQVRADGIVCGNRDYLGTFDTPHAAKGIAVLDSIAYIADDNSGLQIVDVSNPASPKLLGSYDTTYGAVNVSVEGATAFVADNSDGLKIIGSMYLTQTSD